MPGIAITATQLTTPETRTLSIFIGGRYVTPDVQWDSFVATDAAGTRRGTVNLRLNRALADVPEVRDQALLRAVDHDANAEVIRSYVRSRRPSLTPGFDSVELVCDDISGILDDVFIASSVHPSETMQSRIGTLWRYAGSHLSPDLSYVQSIGSTLPAQSFAGVSLRQAIESTISQASSSADYYVDPLGHLHVLLAQSNPAPYNLATASPGTITNSGTRGTVTDGTLYRAFPGLGRMADGRLILVYRSATGHNVTDGNIVMRTSADDGLSWSAERTIVNDASLDLRDPNVLVRSNGTVLVSYFSWDGADARVIEVIKSSDNGVTWGSRITVADAFTTTRAVTGATVELGSGDLLMPIYGRNGTDSFDTAAVLKSTDGGDTWGTQVTIASGPADSRHYQEPCLVKLASGTLVALIRSDTDGTAYRSTSTDSGATWSAVASVFTGGGRPSSLLLTSGTIVCCYRSTAAGSQAAFRTSTDDGVTWSAETTLDTGSGTMMYAWPVQLPSGRIVVAYAIEASSTVTDVYVRSLIGEIVPERLDIDWDSNAYANRVYIQGANPAGSGYFQDAQAISDANGVVRTKVLQAPDCWTQAMAQAMADMYLGRVSSAAPRGSFQTTNDGWRSGQTMTLSSSEVGISGTSYRISRVTRRYARPGTDPVFRYDVEFGGSRATS